MAHALQDVGLDHVGVLVLVDQNMIEPPADLLADFRVRGEGGPVEQQVVVIEHLLGALAAGVLAEDLRNPLLLVSAPGIPVRDHVGQLGPAIDDARVEADQRLLLRKALLLLPHPEVTADEVHQVRGIRLVHHRELRREPQGAPVVAQQPVAHRVKRAAPHLPARRRLQRALRDQPRGPLEHLLRSAPREGQQQDAIRRDALLDQPRDPRSERLGLPRARPGDNQERPARVRHRLPLRRVQLLKPLGRHQWGSRSENCRSVIPIGGSRGRFTRM